MSLENLEEFKDPPEEHSLQMHQVLPFALAVSQIVKVSQRAKSLRKKRQGGEREAGAGKYESWLLSTLCRGQHSLLESRRRTLCLKNPTGKWQAEELSCACKALCPGKRPWCLLLDRRPFYNKYSSHRPEKLPWLAPSQQS